MFKLITDGYLVADPNERSYTDERGTRKVANFRVACHDDRGQTHFINCSAWNTVDGVEGRGKADIVMRNLCKGRHVLITGTPDAKHNKGSDGKDYANMNVVIATLEFLDRKPDSMRANGGATEAAPAAATAPEAQTPAAPAAPAQPAAPAVPQLTPEMIAALQAFMAQQAASQAQAPAQTPAQPAKEEPAACPDFTALEEQLPDNLPF